MLDKKFVTFCLQKYATFYVRAARMALEGYGIA
jgi:hypothetical protein